MGVEIPAERGTPPELFPSTGRVAERAPRGSWNLGVSAGREHGSDCSVTRTDDPDHSFATERPISDPAGAQQATSLTLSDQLSRTRHEFEPRWSLRWLYLLSAAIWVLVEMLLRRPSSVAVFRTHDPSAPVVFHAAAGRAMGARGECR